MSYRTRQLKVAKRKRAASIKRNAFSPNAKWRTEPATEAQIKVLNLIKSETGEDFNPTITRGQASVIIGERFANSEVAAAAARRRARRVRGGQRRPRLVA